MTCIVGVEHDGKVWIGGDSAGVADYSITVRSDTKVFDLEDYVMGFTSSFRMGQILHYGLLPPAPKLDDLERFMVTEFINATRLALRDGGFSQVKNEVETGGTFLVGVGGRLFCVEDDYQVGSSHDGYMAVGCGADIALGVLHATRGKSPARRIQMALEAAAHHSAGVAAPFTIVNV